MDHLQRAQQEFTRQARTFASAPEVTDAALTRRCAFRWIVNTDSV